MFENGRKLLNMWEHIEITLMLVCATTCIWYPTFNIDDKPTTWEYGILSSSHESSPWTTIYLSKILSTCFTIHPPSLPWKSLAIPSNNKGFDRENFRGKIWPMGYFSMPFSKKRFVNLPFLEKYRQIFYSFYFKNW